MLRTLASQASGARCKNAPRGNRLAIGNDFFVSGDAGFVYILSDRIRFEFAANVEIIGPLDVNGSGHGNAARRADLSAAIFAFAAGIEYGNSFCLASATNRRSGEARRAVREF